MYMYVYRYALQCAVRAFLIKYKASETILAVLFCK